jgi:7,8-dihydro-6-hydroxymethylpterin-pyrophosphokinase
VVAPAEQIPRPRAVAVNFMLSPIYELTNTPTAGNYAASRS